MELTPQYKAERYRRQARDSVTLAMKAHGERPLALLIDTAIEMNRLAQQARRELGNEDRCSA